MKTSTLTHAPPANAGAGGRAEQSLGPLACIQHRGGLGDGELASDPLDLIHDLRHRVQLPAELLDHLGLETDVLLRPFRVGIFAHDELLRHFCLADAQGDVVQMEHVGHVAIFDDLSIT